MARRAGLLLMPLGLLGALAWGLEVRGSPRGPETQGLMTFVAGWFAMGVGGLLLWRAKLRAGKGVLPAAVVLFVAAPFICTGADCAFVASMLIIMGTPPLLLLACALALVLRRQPAPDPLSEGTET